MNGIKKIKIKDSVHKEVKFLAGNGIRAKYLMYPIPTNLLPAVLVTGSRGA